MGFLNNIFNGVKGFISNNTVNPKILMNGKPITQVNPITNGLITNSTISQNQNPVVSGANQRGINANSNVQNQSQITGANKIINAIKNSQLRPSNWKEGTRQTVSNVLFGIGQNMLKNPNEDVLNNILSGVNAGIQNQINFRNVVNTMKQNGVDPSSLSPFANYNDLTWDKIQNIGIKQQQNQIRQDIANANDNTKRLNLILTALRNNTISPEEAQIQAKLYGLDVGSMQNSNDTRKTDSQIEVNDERKNLLKKQAENVGKPKITINKRVGGTTSTVNINHTEGGSSSSSKREKKLLY